MEKKKSFKSALSDIKLKSLSPTLRQKKRFLKVKIISDKKFEFKEISESLIDHLILYLGAIDFSKSGIWILRDKFDEANQTLILKCSTNKKDKLIAILTLFGKISNLNCKLEIINVSGTLKGVEKTK